MGLKARLRRQLEGARQLSERLLADFRAPHEWTHQVCPGGNHALWFVGHMAHTDNFFVSLLAPERALPDDEQLSARFGLGSQPVNDPSQYPPPDELLERMRDRRRTLLEVLEGLTDDQLARPTPAGAPEFLSDYASVFEMAVWHEGLHSGQLSVCRRALGHPPLVS